MSDNIIGNETCPACREGGHDKTGNHLLIFKDGGKVCTKKEYHMSGKNYSEGSTASEKEEDTPTRQTVLGRRRYELKDIQSAALRQGGRGIAEYVLARYGVRAAFDTSTGEACVYAYPYYTEGKLSAFKIRELPKRFQSVGTMKGCQLFGQQLTSKSKRLLITGGEEDAMAAYQMLKARYPKGDPAVVSLPNGESVSGLSVNTDYLNKFEIIIVCMDNDAAGRKATSKICKLLGDKALTMKLPLKDANDMLREGRADEFVDAYFSATTFAPDGFVTIEDVWEKATTMPTWGRLWPWDSLNKLTYGRRDGEGMFAGAGVKIGKSEFVNQLAHHITQVEKGSVALFKLEEEPAMTVRKIAGKIMNKQFHIPDGDFTAAQLEEGVKRVGDKVVMYDNYGAANWDDLKMAIRYAVVEKGCKDIIIDPLTRLTVGLGSGEANTELERISDEVSKMAKDLGFFYIFLCHLKAPQGGKPHEEGGKVRSNQFTGSRAMMRSCYFMLGIERDKTLADEAERNTSHFVLLEDRAFGNSGTFPVRYERKTGSYLEPAPITVTAKHDL